MDVKPVKCYSEPKFPTHSIICRHPELLRLVPKRWRKNPVVVAALAALCAMTVTCQANAGNKSITAKACKVAPIFEHGNGRASFGGIGGDVRTFLSEDEARKIVQDEARRSGLNFVADIRGVGGLNVPRPDRYGFLEKRRPEVSETVPESPKQQDGLDITRIDLSRAREKLRNEEGPLRELAFDGTDETLNVSYEYVSEYDFKQWETRHHSSFCTVADYDLLTTAQSLHNGLAGRDQRGFYSVFYDPLISSHEIWEREGKPVPKIKPTSEQIAANNARQEKAAIEASREALRSQVKDFIKWLKAQGVI